MKTTIDIPGELYRQVKARSAILGRSVREVTIDLYRQWLAEPEVASTSSSQEQWLDEWIRLGDSLLEGAPDGPTATEIIAADRDRLDPR